MITARVRRGRRIRLKNPDSQLPQTIFGFAIAKSPINSFFYILCRRVFFVAEGATRQRFHLLYTREAGIRTWKVHICKLQLSNLA